MKRQKTLLILGGVLVVLCGVIVAEKLITRHEDKVQTTDEVVLAIDQEGITEVSWKYEDANLDFVKKDNVWYSADDEAFPVDQDAMSDFLDHFASVHADFIVDDVTDYDQYGLDNPECTIDITTEDVTTTVKFGDFSTMDNQRYMTTGDGRVFLIEDDLVAYFVSDRDSLMANDKLQSFDELDEITVSGEDNLDILYEPDAVYTYTDIYQYFLIDGENHLPLDTTNVNAYLENLTGETLTDYMTYAATEDDIATYGLDDPELTIIVSGKYDPDEETEDTEDGTSTDASSDTTAASDAGSSSKTDAADLTDGSYTVLIGLKDGDKDNAYLMVDGSSIIYKISIDTYNNLVTGDYNSLRPTDVVDVDWDKVDSIDMTIDGETYTAIADHSDDTVTWAWDEATAAKAAEDTSDVESTEATETTEDTEADSDIDTEFSTLTDDIDLLAITAFNDKTPSRSMEYSVTLHLENEDYPELTIDVYQYDGDSCLVLLNGETLGLVDRTSAVDLQEAINSLVLDL